MRIDMTAHQRVITRAALDMMQRFQRDRQGLDDGHPMIEFERVLRGKIGEAAWALLLGYDVEKVVLDDGPGRPDIEAHGWKLDSKATQPGSSYIGVRAEYLAKTDLERWVLLGSRVDVDTWTAELIGSIRATRIRDRQLEDPAEGHSARYIKLPIELFDTAVLDRRAG